MIPLASDGRPAADTVWDRRDREPRAAALCRAGRAGVEATTNNTRRITRPCAAWLLVAALVLAFTPARESRAQLPVPVPPPAPNSQEILKPLSFKWVTQLRVERRKGKTTTRTNVRKGTTLADAANPRKGIDVDGDGRGDLTATAVALSTTQFRIEVRRKHQQPLPVRVELVSGEPVTDDNQFVAFGYDNRDELRPPNRSNTPSDAPDDFTATIEVPSQEKRVLINFSTPTGQLVRLVGEKFVPRDLNVETERFARISSLAIDYGPVGGRPVSNPSRIEANSTEPELGRTEILLTNNQAASATALIGEARLEREGGRVVRFLSLKNTDATITTLPGSLTVGTNTRDGKLESVDYLASDRIDNATIKLTEAKGTRIKRGRITVNRLATTKSAAVTLRDAPPNLTLSGPESLSPLELDTKDAGGQPQKLGFLDAVLGTGGEICSRAARAAGVPSVFCARPPATAGQHTIGRFVGPGKKPITATRLQLVGLLSGKVTITPVRFDVEASFERALPLRTELLSASGGRGIDRTISIRAATVPETLDVEASLPKFERVSYKGSAPMPSLVVRASDKRRLFDLKDAKGNEPGILIRDLELTINDLPRAVRINRTGDDPGTKTTEPTVIESCTSLFLQSCLPADRAAIGRIEATMSGPKFRRAPVARPRRASAAQTRLSRDLRDEIGNHDGVAVSERAARFELFARVSGFRRLLVLEQGDENDGTKRFDVDATGNRVFQAVVLQPPEVLTFCRFGKPFRRVPKRPFVRATLDSLKPNTEIEIKNQTVTERPAVKKDNGCTVSAAKETKTQRISYRADAAAQQLRLLTNEGSRAHLKLLLGGVAGGERLPVPRRFDFCKADDGTCSPDARLDANQGSFRFQGSEESLVNLFDCQKPITGCTRGNAKASVAIDNLKFTTLAEGAGNKGRRGDVFLSTATPGPGGTKARTPASGSIVIKRHVPRFDVPRIEIHFPVGFFAVDRTARFEGAGPDPPFSGGGPFNCPKGTRFVIEFDPGPDQNVHNQLCGGDVPNSQG